MATITPSATPIAGGYLIEWHGVSAGDTCTAWPDTDMMRQDAATLTDRVVQVTGGTISIEGANNISSTNATYATLHEVDGTTTLLLTTASIRQVLEPTMFVRPAPTGGASSVHVRLKAILGRDRF